MVGKTDTVKLWNQVKTHPNVVGYAPKLMPRVVNGKPRHGGWYFRVYVSHKFGEDELDIDDILPESINSIPVDVVEFSEYFRDEIRLSGEFILIDDAYIGESCFLLP